jgi:hypothetical protein
VLAHPRPQTSVADPIQPAAKQRFHFDQQGSVIQQAAVRIKGNQEIHITVLVLFTACQGTENVPIGCSMAGRNGQDLAAFFFR